MRSTWANIVRRSGRKDAPALCWRQQVDAEGSEKPMTGIGYFAGVSIEDDMLAFIQRVANVDPYPTGEVVITGARRGEPVVKLRFRTIARRSIGGERHDGFQCPRHLRRCEPIVTVPSLLFDREKTGLPELRQMRARRLRGYSRREAQLKRRQRPV